jgi:hypothetical protein
MSGIIFGGTVTPSRLSPNLFKNPNFAVIQGTASGTLANSTALPTASLGYRGETEWCIAASGGTPAYTFNSINESVTFTGAASTSAIYLLQRLESRDTNRIKNKTVTFSCEISNSLLTSVIWEVFRPTTSADVHGTIATPTQTLIASGTFTVSSMLTRYSATFALPDLASRGLEVRLRVGAQTSGTWVVSRLQLEEGSTVTSFNCGDFDDELRKCLRYYLPINTSQNYIWYGEAASRGHSPFLSFPCEMFAAPITDSGWTNSANATVMIAPTTTKLNAKTQIGNVSGGAGAGATLTWGTFSAHIP